MRIVCDPVISSLHAGATQVQLTVINGFKFSVKFTMKLNSYYCYALCSESYSKII